MNDGCRRLSKDRFHPFHLLPAGGTAVDRPHVLGSIPLRRGRCASLELDVLPVVPMEVPLVLSRQRNERDKLTVQGGFS